jgi:hypothetical protein
VSADEKQMRVQKGFGLNQASCSGESDQCRAVQIGIVDGAEWNQIGAEMD